MIEYMMGHVSAFAVSKAAVGLGFALGPIIAWRYWNKVGIRCGMLYYILRFAIISSSIIYIEGPNPWGDIVGWYQHACWMLDCGYLPGRDFCSPYHLGFNGLIALSVKLLHNPCSIVFAFTLAEAIGMVLLFHSLKRLYNKRLAKRVVILSMASPVIVTCAFSTQDEALLLCGLASILYFAVKKKEIGEYLAAFITFALTKILAPVYMVAFFVRKRWKGLVVFAIVLALYWGIAIILGTNPFDLRFGRTLGMDPMEWDYNYDHPMMGTLWTFLPQVKPWMQCGIFFAASCLTGLCYVSALFKRDLPTADSGDKLRIAISLATLIYLIFNITYTMSYVGYMIPVVPFILLATISNTMRWKNIAVFSVTWCYMLVYTMKEGVSSLREILFPSEYVLCAFLILADIFIGVVVMLQNRRNMTNVVFGIKQLIK